VCTRVQQGDRGVNGGEGRVVVWPGGEAAMAPQARRGDDGERVPWWAAGALEWGSDGNAQQGSSRAAAGQRAWAVERRSERGRSSALPRAQGGIKGERE
jgi:hypothetical protein